ncbi:MAG: 2-phospho-L-lactate transferase [Aggregatilineales bacterium]
MKPNKVVLLVGGVGGAKLAYGLYRVMPPEDLTIIVNTGDDFWHYGLRICPDLDTVMYTLAELVDKTNGWGVAGDTRNMIEGLRHFGETPWFGLGDKDLATHLLRTQMWHSGETLTKITRRLTSSLHISCTILPMTDTPVATIFNTVEAGELPFQEYFVKHRWQPTVTSLRFDDIENAVVSTSVRSAIENADTIIIGPSNPWLSVDPILNIPEMRDLIVARDVPRIAVTPIIAGDAVKGPAAKLMREWGYPVSAERVAQHYGDVINGFIHDVADADFDTAKLTDSVVHSVAMDTMMTTYEKREQLARQILKWTEETYL